MALDAMVRRVAVPSVARKAGLGRNWRGLASQAAGVAHAKTSWPGVTTSGSMPSTENAGPAKNHTGMTGLAWPGCQAWLNALRPTVTNTSKNAAAGMARPNFTASHKASR